MKKYWIWFPGDFEIHEGMLQNFSREERGMRWPAYWYIDDCYKNVKFEKTYEIAQSTKFTVHTHQQGYMTINNKKHRLNTSISLSAGKYKIIIYVFSPNQLPTVFIDGNEIYSDPTWFASNNVVQRLVGYSNLFTSLKDDPANIPYAYKDLKPRSFQNVNGGLLIDFGKEINATLKLKGVNSPITICYGESVPEALDTKMCYYQQSDVTNDSLIPKRAFRYLFVPHCSERSLDIIAQCIFLPIENRAEFESDDGLVNRIWDASVRTFKLCSDLFYIDGIKRDRWIWGGDAYQDNFINQYSYFNEDIDKRTIIALRGHDEIHQQINTIVDYSLLWIISIYNHYEMTGDKKFLKMIMPRAESMMQYLLDQTNDLGFIYARHGDWIFVDWSEMDKDGTVAAEQMFLLQALKAIVIIKRAIGEDAIVYQTKCKQLEVNIVKYFWDEKKGAFIDCYESGKRHVTRHANILAIVFNLVDSDKQKLILNNVLLNDQVTQLTTPYFKFFEQDALCKLGKLTKVYKTIKGYWGSMIKRGATTIWEQYDPTESGKKQYAMYGDPFGKSLCHAWGGSPVYLLGRYFVGLKPTAVGYQTFEVHPHLKMFNRLNCTLPVKNGYVHIKLRDNKVIISSNRTGGTVIDSGKRIMLKPDNPVKIDNG